MQSKSINSFPKIKYMKGFTFKQVTLQPKRLVSYEDIKSLAR